MNIADKVELKGTVKTVAPDGFALELTELYIDGKWESFKVPKDLPVLTADYDPKVLSASELTLFNQMLTKYSSTLTCPDDIAVANSAKSKLS